MPRSLESQGFPGGSDDKESAQNVGDPSSIPGMVRSSGEGNSNPLQYSYLENAMDRGTWQATVHKVTDGPLTERKNVIGNIFVNQRGIQRVLA